MIKKANCYLYFAFLHYLHYIKLVISTPFYINKMLARQICGLIEGGHQ